MAAEKTIFFNDAEVAVLSILLANADMAHELNGLKHFMFASNTHATLFLEIQGRIENQTPTDPALIIAQMEGNNTIATVGGKKYIEQLAGGNYNKETLHEYMNIIIKAYKARQLVSICAVGSNPDKINLENIDDKLVEFKRALETLQDVRGGMQTIHLGDSLQDIYTDIVARQANPNGIAGVSWGEDLKSLDTGTGGKCAGDLWVIGGRPGMAKTALILNSILSDAKAGVASLLFEREMRTPQVAERFISMETGIPINNIRLGILTAKELSRIYDACQELQKLPIYIDTSYRTTDPYYIESTVTKYKNTKDIKVVYLDYIGLLVDRDENQTQEIGRYSRLFKSLSNELGLCSIIVSQLNRGVEMRDNKRPIMSDLRQSGNLEEDADIVIGLYRDEYYNPESRYKGLMEFLILKHRNGPPGTLTLKFDQATNKITGA